MNKNYQQSKDIMMNSKGRKEDYFVFGCGGCGEKEKEGNYENSP